MLEVSAQAPIATEPSECPFYDPPARNHHKAFGLRGTVGDLQSPAAALFDPLHDRLIASIGPEELQATPSVMDVTLDADQEFLPNYFPSGAVRDTRTMDHDQQEQPNEKKAWIRSGAEETRPTGRAVHCGGRSRHLHMLSLATRKHALQEYATCGAREQHHNGRETKGCCSSRSATPSGSMGPGGRRPRGNRLPRRSRTDVALHR